MTESRKTKAKETITQAVEAVGAVGLEYAVTDPVFHGDVSIRAHLAHTFGPLIVRPIVNSWPLGKPTFTLLKAMDHLAGLAPGSRDVVKTSVVTETWSAHHYEPLASNCGKVIVYFHGGAFLSCGLGTHRSIVEALSVENNCAIMSVGYRQFPEVLFDATVTDCIEAVQWLLEKGVEPHNIVLAGDSAGGGLSFRVAGDLLKSGVRVGGVIALSGWLDFDATEKASHRWAKKDAYIPSGRLEAIAKLILGRKPREEDSPLQSISEDFPPILLICGANEVLRVDTEAAHARAVTMGVSVETHFFRGGVHAFPVATRVFPEGPKARQIMKNFIAKIGTYS